MLEADSFEDTFMGFVDPVVMKTFQLDPPPPRASTADSNTRSPSLWAGSLPRAHFPSPEPDPLVPSAPVFPLLLGTSPHSAKPVSKCKLVTPSPPRLLECPLSLGQGEAPLTRQLSPKKHSLLVHCNFISLTALSCCPARGHQTGAGHLLGKGH